MTASDRAYMLREIKALFEGFKSEITSMVKKDRKDLYDALVGIGLIDSEEELWTKRDVMQKYGISRGTIDNMMKNGQLPFVKKGRSKSSPVFFRPADVRIAFFDKT